MEAKKIVRGFTGTDAYMVESARTLHGLVNLDLAKFTAFDTTITAAFQTQFLAHITAADTVIADTAVIDQLGQTTEVVVAVMDTARAKYNEVKYFVLKAFPTSVATQGEFGLNDYLKVRRKENEMILFLDEMHKACVKYQAKLITAGYNVAAITAIQTIRTDLINRNTTQEIFKKQRPKLTEDRVAVLNTCYNDLSMINAAAQIIYATDFAKQKQFIYNPSSDTVLVELSGTVLAGKIKNAGSTAFSEDKIFTFRNTGLAPLVFCLSASEDCEGIEVAIGGGAVVTKSALDLNANATNLLVKNTDAVLEGSYEIEIDE